MSAGLMLSQIQGLRPIFTSLLSPPSLGWQDIASQRTPRQQTFGIPSVLFWHKLAPPVTRIWLHRTGVGAHRRTSSVRSFHRIGSGFLQVLRVAPFDGLAAGGCADECPRSLGGPGPGPSIQFRGAPLFLQDVPHLLRSRLLAHIALLDICRARSDAKISASKLPWANLGLPQWAAACPGGRPTEPVQATVHRLAPGCPAVAHWLALVALRWSIGQFGRQRHAGVHALRPISMALVPKSAGLALNYPACGGLLRRPVATGTSSPLEDVVSVAKERWRAMGVGLDLDGHVLDCLAWAGDTWVFAASAASLDGMIGVLRQVAWRKLAESCA